MKKCILALMVVFFAGCGKKEVTPELPPLVRGIFAEVTEVVLPESGSVKLPFSVEDPRAVFDYDVLSDGCQVEIRVVGKGTPPESYSLTSVATTGKQGEYIATLTDNGTDFLYSESAVIAIISTDENLAKTIITSNSFKVESEAVHNGDVILKTGLPIVTIETKNQLPIRSKDNYVDATMKINGVKLYDDFQSEPCQIRGRGNTTWYWPKKPYLVKFDKKAKVLGMPKHKRWVLLANFMDRTLMRNIVAYKVASLTSLAWTPRSVPVELVLNGKHMGNYLLIEQVRVDNDRVDITEMLPTDVDGEAVTGGYLLELDFHYDNKIQWLSPYGHCHQFGNGGIPFGIKSPDEDEIVGAQINWIKKHIDEVASVLYGEDFADPVKGYARYIDLPSFIDYWLVFEIMGNHELGNPGSVFMHKDRGGKLVAGPTWDFDWGSLSYNTSPHAKTGLVNGSAIWYERLMQDPEFIRQLYERWTVLKPVFETIPSFIDEQEALLSRSAEINFSMWNPADDRSQNGGQIINGDENIPFHDAVARLRTIFIERIAVIDTALGHLREKGGGL